MSQASAGHAEWNDGGMATRLRAAMLEPSGQHASQLAQRLVKTAWTVMVLCMEAMPIWFQVRP